MASKPSGGDSLLARFGLKKMPRTSTKIQAGKSPVRMCFLGSSTAKELAPPSQIPADKFKWLKVEGPDGRWNFAPGKTITKSFHYLDFKLRRINRLEM